MKNEVENFENTTKTVVKYEPVLAEGFLYLSDFHEDVLKRAIVKYGDKAQIIKAIEEFSELNQVLCRVINDRFNVEDLTSELVDASIMLKQLFKVFSKQFGIHEFEGYIKEWKDYKIDRLDERLNNGTNP